MSASARLAVSLSMATFVTRDSSIVCTPLQATIAKADLAQKQSMIQLGLATRLHVKEACPATQIAAEDAETLRFSAAAACGASGLARSTRLATLLQRPVHLLSTRPLAQCQGP